MPGHFQHPKINPVSPLAVPLYPLPRSSSIPFYEWTAFCFSIHLWMDIWVLSTFEVMSDVTLSVSLLLLFLLLYYFKIIILYY